MKKLTAQVELANRVVSLGRDLGMGHLKVQQILNNGKTVVVNDKKLTSFASCGYLGLEFDPRLQQSIKDSVDTWGTHFACSRSYLQLGIIDELEAYLSQIFNKPTLYAQSTSLGHIAIIPTIIGADEAIILDHRVHNSVMNAVGIAKSNGTYVEMVRHNNMEMLEARIKKLQDQYERIWYMADGVYSMLGDVAPVEELNELMQKYDKFHVYYDDAHGMSWTGENGAGYVLSKTQLHEKMILVTSLGKGFGTLGGAMILPDKEMHDLVRNLGSTLMFTFQPQPATIMASIAAAKIHLSPEIQELQKKVKANIQYFNLTAKARSLPFASDGKTPIAYLGVGSPEAAFSITRKIIDSGFFVNSVIYPAVPHKNTGLRMNVTANHSFADIYELLNCIADEFKQLEQKKVISRTEIVKSFAGARG